MTKLPTKADLRRETRNWLNRGVIPAIAAETRRSWSASAPGGDPWHDAIADEWDRIAATQPAKVAEAYRRQINYAVECLAHQKPGSDLAKYWQDQAAKWDRALSALNITE